MNRQLYYFFYLILYVPSTIFQSNRDGSSWVEPVLSEDKCVLLKDHNAVKPVRLKPVAPQSRVKHSITESLRSHNFTKNQHFRLIYYSTIFYIMGNICKIRPNKKNMCGSGYTVKKVRVGKYETIFFFNFFSWNIQTCLEMY